MGNGHSADAVGLLTLDTTFHTDEKGQTRREAGAQSQGLPQRRWPGYRNQEDAMQLTFDARQDIKRFLAIGAVSMGFIVAQAAPALAATDPDRDGLTNYQERNVTETSPFDADSDDDKIRDGNEDEDQDGVDNTNELTLKLVMDDEDSDNDGLEDGDEDKDRDAIDNEDEDDLDGTAEECSGPVEDDADQDGDDDDLDDEDEDDLDSDVEDTDEDGLSDYDDDNDDAAGKADIKDEDDDCDGEEDEDDLDDDNDGEEDGEDD